MKRRISNKKSNIKETVIDFAKIGGGVALGTALAGGIAKIVAKNQTITSKHRNIAGAVEIAAGLAAAIFLPAGLKSVGLGFAGAGAGTLALNAMNKSTETSTKGMNYVANGTNYVANGTDLQNTLEVEKNL